VSVGEPTQFAIVLWRMRQQQELLRRVETNQITYRPPFSPKCSKCVIGKDPRHLRADPLRHPLIFYFGHTDRKQGLIGRVDPLFDESCKQELVDVESRRMDEMSWDDLDEKHYDWPSVAEVQAYRDRVRAVVDDVIQTLPLQLPITWDSPWWVIMMGIEHARIHLETPSVLIRQLPIEHVRPHPLWEICRSAGAAPENELIDVPAGEIALGKQKNHPLYSWDNEFGTHSESIKAFRASRYLVSNREFLEFIDDSGYTTQSWWTDEGWRWREYKQATHPLFWIPASGSYRLRTVAEEIDMPWDWPVELNYLESKAFCNWKSSQIDKTIRLPTEEEWYLLRDRAV
jgi:5-histidylcysteine sulfoxide synthase